MREAAASAAASAALDASIRHDKAEFERQVTGCLFRLIVLRCNIVHLVVPTGSSFALTSAMLRFVRKKPMKRLHRRLLLKRKKPLPNTRFFSA